MVETIETKFHEGLIRSSIQVTEGFVSAPQAPGLGIEVDEELARANPFEGEGLHLQMQDNLVSNDVPKTGMRFRLTVVELFMDQKVG